MAKDANKLAPEEVLTISRKLFLGGFCLLPFLWVYNLLYLWPIRHRSDITPQVRKHLMFSAVGSLVMFVISSTWFAIFVNFRLDWGAVGDNLTVVLVKGV
ncbi:hypothetical protein BGZ73_004681 [Actinomortierella ambigua]|nr:hypothetical protein BGZ73_004681 [Actinomortierella ambigua]